MVSIPIWCSVDLSYTERDVSPMYLCIFISSFLFFLTSSSSSSSPIFLYSLPRHSWHQISYTALLFVQSWVLYLSTFSLVPQRRHNFLLQSIPHHWSLLCIMSSNLVPTLFTVLRLHPVSICSISCFSTTFLVCFFLPTQSSLFLSFSSSPIFFFRYQLVFSVSFFLHLVARVAEIFNSLGNCSTTANISVFSVVLWFLSESLLIISLERIAIFWF